MLNKYTNIFYLAMNLKAFYRSQKKFSYEKQLQTLYKTTADPWNYESSPYERFRFEKTLALVKSVPHTTVLELGCSEGYFTKLLYTISKNITAIDLSDIAIQRAKKRVQNVTYHVTTFENFKIKKPFDIIICSELLYYVKDKQAFVDKMANSGNYIITSHAGLFSFAYTPYFSKLKRLKKNFFILPKEKTIVDISLWKS